MTNKISLRYCEDYSNENIRASLNKCFADLGGISNFIEPKSKVLLNCSLTTASEPNEAKTTHPVIVSVLSEMIEKAGASCIIAGLPNHPNLSIQKVYEKTGMLDASNNGNAQLNTNFDVYKLNVDGIETKELTLLDAFREADIVINIPKLVVNGTIHGALDSNFGLQPSEARIIVNNRLFDLTRLYNYLSDLYFAVKDKVVLTLVDAVVSREANESQRILNALIAGENPVAIDSCIYKILNKNFLESVEYEIAKNRDILKDEKQIEILGDKVEKFVKTNFVCSEHAVINHEFTSSETKKVASTYKAYQARPKVVIKQCKGCEVCTKICPNRAINMKFDENEEMYASISSNKCIHCFKCVHNCPYSAIKVVSPSKYKKLNNRLNKRLSTKK